MENEHQPVNASRSTSPSQKIEDRRRYGLVVFASLYTFCVFGAFFGWGPMQLLLEENGNFSSKCTRVEQEQGEICPEQSAALVNVHFFALVSQITSPLLGEIADRYGACTLAYCMAGCAWVGFAFLVVATKFVIDELLYPAYILFGMTTWTGAILNLHVGLKFGDNHTRSRVIFVLSSLFDAGAITFLGLQAISEGTDATVPQVIGGYFGLTILLFGGGSYFWAVAKTIDGNELAEEQEYPTEYLAESQRTKHEHDISAPAGSMDEASTAYSPGSAEKGKPLNERATTEIFRCKEENKLKTMEDASVVEEDAVSLKQEEDEMLGVDVQLGSESTYVIIAQRSMYEQLTSRGFLLLAFFWMIQCTANQWTLTTTRDFLASLGDDEVNNKYLTIFTFMMPASLAALPFTDAMLRHFGFGGGFQCINFLAVGYNLIRLLSDNLNVQVLGFIIFSFFRSFLFGICLSFLPVLLASEVVGKASGLLFALSGAAAFANVPLSSFAIETQNGDFFVPNLIYTLLLAPCFVAAWGIGGVIKQENAAKEEQKKWIAASAHLRQSLGGVILRDGDG